MRPKDHKSEGSARTRAEEQRHVNDAYAKGDMTRDGWRRATDELSDLSVWSAAGRVKNNV
jgi:hypothetical protein